MAEDSSDLERTEPASQKRLEQAREEGQVARSRELSTFAVLAAGGGSLWFMGPGLMQGFSGVMRDGLSLDRAIAFDTELLPLRLHQLSFDALFALAPVFALVAGVALVSPLALNGWLFTAKPLTPDFQRLDPVRGFARLFSLHSAVELMKAVAKAFLVGGVAAWVLWRSRDQIFALVAQPLGVGLAHLGQLLGFGFLALAGALVLIAAVDVPFQLWEHHRKLRMTRDELRREARETEGDPQIKARVRTLQREAARRRMMAEVPKADVIVTNPTHYAVALRYREGAMRAPQVVAKGAHLLAARIRELAQEHGVPILEAPPLARALYRHAELGGEIPEALFHAVAEVLAYVYQLRRHRERGGAAPQLLRQLPVPADLDPDHPADRAQ